MTQVIKQHIESLKDLKLKKDSARIIWLLSRYLELEYVKQSAEHILKEKQRIDDIEELQELQILR